MRTVFLFFILLLPVYSQATDPTQKAEPEPSNGRQYLFNRNRQVFQWKAYDADGKLSSEGEESLNYIDISIYSNGKWSERWKIYSHGRLKEEQLPPKDKPYPIHRQALFNFDFKKWEYGYAYKGKKDGVWMLWWPEGKPAGMVEYKNGVYSGRIQILYENGKLAEEGFFISGKKEGDFLTYYESGSVMEKIPYLNGLTHGLYILYKENGEELIRYKLYKGKVSK
jgi:antitoxin component YwqK of YwqJK toxin-antitoxin module